MLVFINFYRTIKILQKQKKQFCREFYSESFIYHQYLGSDLKNKSKINLKVTTNIIIHNLVNIKNLTFLHVYARLRC